MRGLPLKLKVYLICLYLFTIGSVAIMLATHKIPVYIPTFFDMILFITFVALAESFIVLYRNIAVSTSFAVYLASVLLFKPFAAMIIIILGFTIRMVKHNGKYVHVLNTPLYKTLYNYCAFIVPLLYSSLIYNVLGGQYSTRNLWNNIHLIIIFSVIFFILNTLIVSILFSIIHNKSMLYFFIINARLGLLSSLAMAPFGIMLAFVYERYKVAGALTIIVPIALARYTFYLYIETKTQYIQTVDSLMLAMEARDKYTEGHSQRVAELSTLIAKEFRYSDIMIERLHMASLLHDVGKIGIDDKILNKPGKLTQEEYETIKSHPEIGYNILKDVKNLQDVLPVIRSHHERYDGKGYPDSKLPEELALDVFIVQLADTVDSMTTDRPYRKALTQEEVISEITKYSGTQFHPKVVQAYLNILEKKKKAV